MSASDKAQQVLDDMREKTRLMDEAEEGLWPTPMRISEWADVLASLLAENEALRAELDVANTRWPIPPPALAAGDKP